MHWMVFIFLKEKINAFKKGVLFVNKLEKILRAIKIELECVMPFILFSLYFIGLPELYAWILSLLFGNCLFSAVLLFIGLVIILGGFIIWRESIPFERPHGEID